MLRYKIRRDDTLNETNMMEVASWEVDGNWITFTTKEKHNIPNLSTGKIVGIHRRSDTLNNISRQYTFSEDVEFHVGNNPLQFQVSINPEYQLNVKDTYTWQGRHILTFTNPHFIPENGSITATLRTYSGTARTDTPITLQYETETSASSTADFPLRYEIYRDDFRFKDANELRVFAISRGYMLQLPMGTFTAVNGRQEELVRQEFVNEEIEKAIPPIVNMEKNAYIPVIKISDDEYVRVEEIEINLHFREREGEDWLVKDKGYWNGFPGTEDGEPDIDRGYDEGTVVFSNVGDKQHREMQSDLLGFLNFANSDVRYQKSRLKKSFLRMLFFDSNNQGGQSLLCSSTVFMDSGNLYGKLVRYADGLYRKPIYNDETGEYESMKNRTGVTVDMEPFMYTKADGSKVGLLPEEDNTDSPDFDYAAYKRDDLISNDFVERRRLSTRMTIHSKFDEGACSEGFYVYLFAADDPNLQHKDLYMRVEFNHAGFGRTIPFMRPTEIDPSTLENGRSYTIDEIVNDPDFHDTESDEPLYGYPLDLYYLHSYVQFKYGYCKPLGEYVYYLAYDNNSDELAIDVDNRKIILNFWEAKVR